MHADEPSKKIKILYIAGMWRSGTTLLANAVGQLDGFINVGEPITIWPPFYNSLCSCGEKFDECKLWQSILLNGFGSSTRAGISGVNKVNFGKKYKLRDTLLHALALSTGWEEFPEDIMRPLKKLYKGIMAQDNVEVIVDESKDAIYAYALSQIPDVELKILHIIRDPRAVVFSHKRKRKLVSSGKQMRQLSTFTCSIRWLTQNISSQMLLSKNSSYKRIKYEEFVASPEKCFSEILVWLGLTNNQNTIISDHQLKVCKPHHLIVSNPVGGQQGTLQIQPDLDWQTQLKPIDKIFTALLTWPLLIYYGYFKS